MNAAPPGAGRPLDGAVAALPQIEPQAAFRFARAPDGESYVARQRVGYPFHVTRPFYLDSTPEGALTLYLQSVSGGIYQGEDLLTECVAEAGSTAHVTTQAATIVHRMPAETARQTAALRAEGDALLEYLPDPLILFPGSRLTSVLDIAAAPDAVVVASESFTHHDPGGRGRRFDHFHAEMRIRDASGRLLALERYALLGDRLAEGAGPAAVWPSQGSFVVVCTGSHRNALLDAMRDAMPDDGTIYAGATMLPNDCGITARILARDGAALRTTLDAAWHAARTILVGAPPGPRRK